jgi:phosphotriesterase-related protein
MIKHSLLSGLCLMILLSQCVTDNNGIVMTVNGPVPASRMGITLSHEHILVDFIGADSITDKRWNKQDVASVALPYLQAAGKLGCKTLIECTPAYLGRDPLLLRSISSASGMNILTNTGYYGAGDNKYIPRFAFDETADQIAARWTKEWESGIENTGIKPGFIKIGVGSGDLSDFHKKLVTAAARTHLKTGLIIASHTGPSVPAFEQLDILKKEGVSPTAFIWVHAQNEKDIKMHIRAARMGAWISLDGIKESNLEEYVIMISNLKENNLLGKVLLSHDAGWYHPGEKNGGEYHGYTTLFEKLIPLLKKANFSEKEVHMLLVANPAEAFTIRVRKI